MGGIPVLIKPVVHLGFGVNGVSEVGGSGRGDPELGFVRAEEIIGQLLVFPFVVLLQNAEVSLLLT